MSERMPMQPSHVARAELRRIMRQGKVLERVHPPAEHRRRFSDSTIVRVAVVVAWVASVFAFWYFK